MLFYILTTLGIKGKTSAFINIIWALTQFSKRHCWVIMFVSIYIYTCVLRNVFTISQRVKKTEENFAKSNWQRIGFGLKLSASSVSFKCLDVSPGRTNSRARKLHRDNACTNRACGNLQSRVSTGQWARRDVWMASAGRRSGNDLIAGHLGIYRRLGDASQARRTVGRKLTTTSCS